MIGPYTIKMNSNHVGEIGITSGSVFAVSTLGSFVGTLSIGFLLLPFLGTTNIVFATSGVLFLLSVAHAIREKRTAEGSLKRAPWAPFLLFFVIVGSLLAFRGEARSNLPETSELLYESESLYGRIKVVDDHQWGVRWLMSDSSTIGARLLTTHGPVFPFLTFLESVPLLHPATDNALLIGLGAGYLPMALSKQGIATDVIEIDPEVAYAAQHYFDFDPPGRFIIGDARFHIKELRETYDYIIHDTFTGGSVPYHLLSQEVAQDLSMLLGEHGIFALVYFGFQNSDKVNAACSVYKTLKSVFPYVRTFVSKKGEDPVDLIFTATKHPLDLNTISRSTGQTLKAQKFIESLKDREISLSTKNGFVITDNYNPLDTLQSRKAEAYREKVLELVGSDLLLR